MLTGFGMAQQHEPFWAHYNVAWSIGHFRTMTMTATCGTHKAFGLMGATRHHSLEVGKRRGVIQTCSN